MELIAPIYLEIDDESRLHMFGLWRKIRIDIQLVHSIYTHIGLYTSDAICRVNRMHKHPSLTVGDLFKPARRPSFGRL